MRTWVVTARDKEGNFIDQRRIEAASQEQAVKDAYAWIKARGGDLVASRMKEV